MDTIKTPDEGRRSFLAASVAAGAVSLLSTQMTAAAGDTPIRPFRVDVPEADLADLRKRVAATKWPEREQVADATQGVQLATMQKLAQYWANEHDLAQVRGEDQCRAELHHRDRRPRHSFHSRSLKA